MSYSYNHPKSSYELQHEDDPYIRGFYRHYKGGLYRAFHTAMDTETQQHIVVYEDLHGCRYVRDFETFDGLIDEFDQKSKHHLKPRYEKLEGWESIVAWFKFTTFRLNL